jgi:hypothetical protein
MTSTTVNFESVKIASGRFVNVGHEVENFGRRCVVLGWHNDAKGLIVREVFGDEMIGGKWVAEPSLCR